MALHRQSRQGNGAVPVIVALVLAAGLASTLGRETDAQDRPVRVEGRVQWVAGQAVQIQVDNGPSVNVDLGSVPLAEYAALRPRERVVVAGVLSSDGRRVIAGSISRPDESPPPRTP